MREKYIANKAHWEKQYKKPLEQIPWEIEKPPRELIQALRGQSGLGKTALDVACGTGNYSLFLAKKGFRVTGIDLSENALKIAKEKTKKAKAKIRLVHADVLHLEKGVKEKFDFILDYSLLHHVPHSKTEEYVRQLIRRLKPGGKLFLVCYSEKDSGGKKTKLGEHGNRMYYRAQKEIEDSYKPLEIVNYRPARLGKRRHHFAHAYLFEKPNETRESRL